MRGNAALPMGRVCIRFLTDVFRDIIPAFDFRDGGTSFVISYLALEIWISIRILVPYSETLDLSVKLYQ